MCLSAWLCVTEYAFKSGVIVKNGIYVQVPDCLEHISVN